MPIFLFVIGVILFLGLGFFIVFKIFEGTPEDYFYRSFGCLLEMTTLSIFFKIWGNYVFTIQAQKWILFSIAIFLLLFIIFYFVGYMHIDLGCNSFEPRLLLMCLPALVEIYFVIATFVKVDFLAILSDLPVFITITVLLLSLTSSIILKFQLKESNSKVIFFERYIHNNLDINFSDLNIINCSQSERTKLEHAIMELYTILQYKHLSPSNVLEFLRRFDIPQNFSNSIVERIFKTNRNCSEPLRIL